MNLLVGWSMAHMGQPIALVFPCALAWVLRFEMQKNLVATKIGESKNIGSEF